MSHKLFRYKNFIPEIGKDVFIADGAKVIGRATIGDECTIWFNAIIRADVAAITIGKQVNVQDLSMIHVTNGIPLTISDHVSIGHSVTLHSCHIQSHCLIGMGCTILDNVVVGDHCLVAANSLLPPNKVYPSGHLIKGNPARADRPLNEKEWNMVHNHYQSYLEYLKVYLSPGNYQAID